MSRGRSEHARGAAADVRRRAWGPIWQARRVGLFYSRLSCSLSGVLGYPSPTSWKCRYGARVRIASTEKYSACLASSCAHAQAGVAERLRACVRACTHAHHTAKARPVGRGRRKTKQPSLWRRDCADEPPPAWMPAAAASIYCCTLHAANVLHIYNPAGSKVPRPTLP